MAAEVKLRFIVTDDGTVQVIDQAGEKFEGVGRKAKDAADVAERGFERIRAAAITTAAAVGAGAIAFGKYAVEQASEFQLLETRLQGLTGSAEQARAKMAQALDIASRTPFEVARVVEAEAILAAFGETSGSTLTAVADLAAFMQRDIVEAAGSFGRALAGGAGAADIFRENGILAIIKANQQLKGDFRELTDLSLAEFREAMLDTFTSGQIEGSAERLSRTFSGMVSNIGDAFSRMAAEVGTIVVHNERIYEIGGDIITEFDQMRIAAQDPAFRAFWSDTVELAGSAATAVSDFGEEVIAQFAVWQLFRDDQVGITDVLKAYGENALGSGSAFRDLLRRYREAKSEIELTGGETWLGTVVAPQAKEAEKEVNNLGGTVDAVKAKIEGFNPIASGLDEFTRQLKLAQGGFYGADVAAQFDEIRTQADLVPGVINDWTDSIEQAQAAAVNLGDVLSDSLVSAVDGLITRGDFNLGDVLESTGKAAMSRMVGAMIKEKLGFDATFRANFLEYLPGIASQGADLISRNFGTGLQSLASQAGNVGQVINGSLAVNGLGAFPDTGYGMSVDALNYGGMTDAATGQTVLASGGAPLAQGAAGAAFGLGPGVLTALGVGGGLALGGIAGSIAQKGVLGRRIEANADTFGLTVAAAALAPMTLGLAPLLVALFGNKAPSAKERRRMAIGDAFRDSGIFPSLAFAKDPTRDFRDAAMPDFLGAVSPETSALALLLGGTLNDATDRLPGTIGSRASVLGLNEEQVRRELRRVASMSGASIDDATRDLTTRFLEFQVNGKGGQFSQQEYLDLLTGTVELLSGDLPRGVDAAAIALANLETVGGNLVLNFEDFNSELERQRGIATSLQGGVAGAGTSAITALLTGGDPTAAFRSGILNTVAGGVASNIVSTIFENGGGFAEALTQAVLAGDAAGVDSALAGVNSELAVLLDAASAFTPVLSEWVDELARGTATAQSYRDQRTGVQGIIDDLRFSRLSPSQQAAELQRRIRVDQGTLAGILADDYIDPETERAQFDRVTGRITSDAQALFRYGSNFAAGSRQAREIEQAALGALGDVESALSLAVGAIETQEIKVGTMNVSELRITPAAAVSLVGGN